MKAAAISLESKNAILVQEIFRRMHNPSLDQPQSVRNKIIDTFDSRLELSGYGPDRRKDIITRGITKFEKVVQQVKKELLELMVLRGQIVIRPKLTPFKVNFRFLLLFLKVI